jgi:hypothetical protein
LFIALEGVWVLKSPHYFVFSFYDTNCECQVDCCCRLLLVHRSSRIHLQPHRKGILLCCEWGSRFRWFRLSIKAIWSC